MVSLRPVLLVVCQWWVASCRSVGDVLVQPPLCISVCCAGASWWRLGGYVMHVVFARYFIQVAVHCDTLGGVWMVSGLWVSCWCWLGVLVVCQRHESFHMGGYFNCVLYLHARTQHTTSNNPASLWPTTSPALCCSYWRSLWKRQIALRVRKRSKQTYIVKGADKQMHISSETKNTKRPDDCAFSWASCFICAGSSF